MQNGAKPPTGDQLQNVFAQVPGLTSVDATLMAKDAHGVLMKGLDAETAGLMRKAFADEGVETEVVDESVLMELPTPIQLTRAGFMERGLSIDNMAGRILELAWNDVFLVAAGRVRLAEFKEHIREQTSGLANDDYTPALQLEAETTEEQRDHWLLEVITTNASARYHIVADKPESMLFFQCLGDRRVKEPQGNLELFLADLATRAPRAVLNHGAFCLRGGASRDFFYPTQTAFYREITWLLWVASSGRLEV